MESNQTDRSFEGRRILITGGSAGIGLATAKMLADRGAKIALMARTEGRLGAAAEHLGATPFTGDVASEEDVVRIVADAAKALGGLDGLINNAAVFYGKPLEAIAAPSFRKLLDINVIGPALMGREVLPHLREAGGGDIINVSSTAGLNGGPNLTAYSASKFALRGMTLCWQAELRRSNIRVTLVNPSEVQTGFGSDRGPRSSEKPNKLFPHDIAHAIVSALEMNKRGYVPEITVHATNPW